MFGTYICEPHSKKNAFGESNASKSESKFLSFFFDFLDDSNFNPPISRIKELIIKIFK